jgi:hypothetical protein
MLVIVKRRIRRWRQQKKGLRSASVSVGIEVNITDKKLRSYSQIIIRNVPQGSQYLLILIYSLTAIGLTHCGSSTVHIYTRTIHRTIPNKQYIEQNNNFGRVGTVPRLCGLYPGICLRTESKKKKNLSQGIRV